MFVSFIKKGNNKTKQKPIKWRNTEKNEIETVAVFQKNLVLSRYPQRLPEPTIKNSPYLSSYGYRIYSINRPGRLLNLRTLRVGAYSRLGAY